MPADCEGYAVKRMGRVQQLQVCDSYGDANLSSEAHAPL